jgi:hypothetical protein
VHPSEYLVSDPVWYEPLETVADGDTRFFAAGLAPPEGWVRSQADGWVAWQPRCLELPAQGWKIHVSALIDEADDVIQIVRDYCVTQNITFKFLRSRLVYLARNEKYASRAASGKLCTLYPVDDAELERTVHELSATLEGRSGPYILSDLRWRSGPLYIRYGGFLADYCFCPETGDLVPGIRDDRGVLVPDPRSPGFRVPPWVCAPGFLAAEIRTMAEAGEEFAYRVESALHFSNGGGVYRGVDPSTGRTVVLREARPHAGLDAHEMDAVSRLASEKKTLERLAGLDTVPALIDSFTRWEHHYLVEEYIDGQLLQHAIAQRYPLIHPSPTPRQIAEYTRWAMATLGRIEDALEAVHRRGIVFADLHPFNIIVRPDGRIVLIDFEESFDVDEQRGSGLGAPGYVAPWPVTGLAVDDYALNSLRLAFFLPITAIIGLDPGKARQLAAVAAQLFRLPASFTDRIVHGFAPPPDWDEEKWRARRPGLRPLDRADGTCPGTANPDWRAWLSSMTAAIAASATPERSDRLFPGDVQQFAEGGISMAHGAAGVLFALAVSGAAVRPEHVEWLARAAINREPALPGLYRGLDGVAAVLVLLGQSDAGLAVACRARTLHADMRRLGLYDGLAGVGLSLLYLGAVTGEPGFTKDALHIGLRLAGAVRDGHAPGAVFPLPAGLMEGWSGVAAFFLGLHEISGEIAHLDLAEIAIRRDLATCVRTKNGGLQVEEGSRNLLYLATGSSGIGLIASRLGAYRPDGEFATAVEKIRLELGTEFVMYPGLFEGRAGLMLAAARLGADRHVRRDTGLARHHLDRLTWHALSYEDHLAFPGPGLMRLSMDLATGTAGIALALHAAFADGNADLALRAAELLLPGLPSHPSATTRRREVTP